MNLNEIALKLKTANNNVFIIEPTEIIADGTSVLRGDTSTTISTKRHIVRDGVKHQLKCIAVKSWKEFYDVISKSDNIGLSKVNTYSAFEPGTWTRITVHSVVLVTY